MFHINLSRASIIKYIKYVICVLAGIIAGLFVFFPWSPTADLAVSKQLPVLAEKNMYVTYKEIRDENLLDKVFILSGLRADIPTAGVEISEIRIDPSVIKTLSGTPSVYIETARGTMTLITKQKLEWNTVSASVQIKDNIVEISDVIITGKLRASGFININPSNQQIVKANLNLTVPEEFDRAFEMAQRTGILPVTKLDKGKWQVKR